MYLSLVLDLNIIHYSKMLVVCFISVLNDIASTIFNKKLVELVLSTFRYLVVLELEYHLLCYSISLHFSVE